MESNKKAQLKISFGMIFSIILVISLLASGFYAIQKFLSMQDSILMGKFMDEFKGDIEKMWKSTQGSKKVQYRLPKQVEKICFVLDPKRNMAIYEDGLPKYYKIDKIDIDKTLGSREALCKKVKDQKIEFVITKNFGDKDVTIKV